MDKTKIRIKGDKEFSNPVGQDSSEVLTLRETYTVGSAFRSKTDTYELSLRQDSLVEFVFEDGISWMSSPEDIKDLFPEVRAQMRSVGADVLDIPDTLYAGEAHRGVVKDIALKMIRVFDRKKRADTVVQAVRSCAEKLQARQLNGYSGLYGLDAQFRLQPLQFERPDQPYLLLLHGTASSTHGSFEELKGTKLWDTVLQNYATNILAFQHETLTKSPLQNVLELLQQLPDHISLDLISHSRGGLLGDILCRFCSVEESAAGFTALEVQLLEKYKRHEDLQHILSIREILSRKQIRIGKFIRVACPAAGTTLASERMDHFFNVLINAGGLALGSVANPVFNVFKDMVASVVDCKDDWTVLPGLEAMNPESPFIKVLNNPAPQSLVRAPLYVIAGNSRAGLNLKSLLIITARLFFNAKNDLVVNTQSMYMGAKRNRAVQYFFDEAAGVDHFHYFSNNATNEAIIAVLRLASEQLTAPGFVLLDEKDLQAEMRNAVLDLEGGQVYRDEVSGKRPIVVLLPGIMGSNLSVDDKIIWINYFRFIAGKLETLAYRDETNERIKAPSLIKTSYKELADHLSGQYDVVTFPFDWRLQLNDSAGRLNDKLLELMEYGMPIKIVGHSMGGVLVRDFIVSYPATWQKLNASKDFRLLFLGSPLGGSFRIPYVLYGYDEIITKIAKIDLWHTKKELLEIFSQLPGLLSLLPLTTDANNDFSDPAIWKMISGGVGDPDWPVPSDAVLKRFGQYRDRINAVSDQIDWSNAVYIAGRDVATPSGYRIENGKTVFLHTAAGDQSVTWDSGIPQQMIGKGLVYYANITHGALSCHASLFAPISDILAKGSTRMLSQNRPVFRSAELEFERVQDYDLDVSPLALEATLLGIGATDSQAAFQPSPLQVSVSNGDLRFSAYPLIAGHFKRDAILNAERSIDRNLKGALSELHQLDLYPGDIGTSELFLRTDSAFKGAVIVGLGEQGGLSAYQLSQTVEQAVAKYLVYINNQMTVLANPGETYGLSALLVGCGYGGLGVEYSIRSILEGVQNANNKMRALRTETARLVSCVEFVEMYEDKALSCLYTLSRITREQNPALPIQLSTSHIKPLLGSRQRLPVENTEEWWTRITVKETISDTAGRQSASLQFNYATNAAREEQRNLLTSKQIMDELLKDISVNNQWSPQIAKTIFELLIPNDFKSQLSKHTNINWIVDERTAAYPWELLQDNDHHVLPLAVNAGMIRQLATQDYRTHIQPASGNAAFVLADPDLKGFIFQLPGAKAEGHLVTELLSGQGLEIVQAGGSAGQIINALFSRPYKIMHLAGHGVFSEQEESGSGMVIGNNVFLSTREICQMSQVPELVFVNCCYLGKMDPDKEMLYTQRYKLAANIGTQLIRNGVKAVIVAGWAIDDAAALDFTRIFYRSMFEGDAFGDAVLRSRKAIFEKYGSRNNTWGAYQCYGDPFFKLVQGKGNANTSGYSFFLGSEAEIEIRNLINKIDLSDTDNVQLRRQLTAIEEAVDNAVIRNSRITELEAQAYAKLGDYGSAVQRYRSLIEAEQADFSFAAMEQYCSLRMKQAIQLFRNDPAYRESAVETTRQVIEDLEVLCRYGATAERLNLLGSTYRRYAYLHTVLEDKWSALAKAADFHRRAYEKNSRHQIHALCNWYNMESLLVLHGQREWGASLEHYKLPERNQAKSALLSALAIQKAILNAETYWELAAKVNLKVALYLLDNEQTFIDEAINDYAQLWRYAGGQSEKAAELEMCDLLMEALSVVQSSFATERLAGLQRLCQYISGILV